MNSDPLRQLERQLVEAADRQRVVLSLPRRPRRPRGRLSVALAAAISILVMAAAALAASGLLGSGAPLAVPLGIPLDPDSGLGVAKPATVRLLSLAVPDPAGGPPWGLRYVATTRGLGCLQAGRLVDGALGVIGDDNAFGNDGRFHALPADFIAGGPFPCGSLDAHGNAFAGTVMYSAPASGLLTPTRAAPGCSRPQNRPPGAPAPNIQIRQPVICPPADERTLYFGMAGPDAKSVTYVVAGHTRTVATSGRQGAYLIVLATPGPGPNGYSPLPGAGGGPIRRIAYRNGYVCVLGPKRLRSETCPHVGQVPVKRPRLTSAGIAAPLAVTVTGGPYHRKLVVSFTARVAVTDASSAYIVSVRFPGSQPRCGAVLSGPLIADNAKGQREHFAQPIGGCHGTFRGAVHYRHGDDTDGIPFDIAGRTLTVGTFKLNVP
ncbi:MAG TPA: hypothetical protein VHW26_12080 [Solirubrobacteraceae bacterium]|jgi:hypothetical protein|nr:hypothetical protein [Solirubrobacteraceae bacterium]